MTNPELTPSPVWARHTRLKHVRRKHAGRNTLQALEFAAGHGVHKLQQKPIFTKKGSSLISMLHDLRTSIAQITHRVRKPVNKHSLWQWYVKLATSVSSPRWSTYASNCYSTFLTTRSWEKRLVFDRLAQLKNMQIETLTLDSLSRLQKLFSEFLWHYKGCHHCVAIWGISLWQTHGMLYRGK